MSCNHKPPFGALTCDHCNPDHTCQACGNPPPLIRFGKTWLCAPCTDYSGEHEKWAAVVAESWAHEKPENSCGRGARGTV